MHYRFHGTSVDEVRVPRARSNMKPNKASTLHANYSGLPPCTDFKLARALKNNMSGCVYIILYVCAILSVTVRLAFTISINQILYLLFIHTKKKKNCTRS